VLSAADARVRVDETMRAEVAAVLEKMIAAARTAGVGQSKPGSGYRSCAAQRCLYANVVAPEAPGAAPKGLHTLDQYLAFPAARNY